MRPSAWPRPPLTDEAQVGSIEAPAPLRRRQPRAAWAGTPRAADRAPRRHRRARLRRGLQRRAKSRPAHIASGFGFWNNTAGFDISQTLIHYSASTSSFGRAFWVGLLNTLLVAAISIVLATVLGFAIGMARLSRNCLARAARRRLCRACPQRPAAAAVVVLVQCGIEIAARAARQSRLPGGSLLNSRGLFLPRPEFAPGFLAVVIALAIGVVAAIVWRAFARRRREQSGVELPVFWPALGLLCGLPLAAFVLAGSPLSFSFPVMGRFNVRGGLEILPEFAALTAALSLYTAAFIAEVVRAGVLSVSAGQSEAAHALGLRPAATLRLIIIPQAMRVIVPPLTSQYLNLIKNSTLAVAIGYPDLFQVFTGTVLNITGQAVEVVAITMAVYLSISLVVSFLMNLYARSTAVVER